MADRDRRQIADTCRPMPPLLSSLPCDTGESVASKTPETQLLSLLVRDRRRYPDRRANLGCARVPARSTRLLEIRAIAARPRAAHRLPVTDFLITSPSGGSMLDIPGFRGAQESLKHANGRAGAASRPCSRTVELEPSPVEPPGTPPCMAVKAKRQLRPRC